MKLNYAQTKELTAAQAAVSFKGEAFLKAADNLEILEKEVRAVEKARRAVGEKFSDADGNIPESCQDEFRKELAEIENAEREVDGLQSFTRAELDLSRAPKATAMFEPQVNIMILQLRGLLTK